MADEDFEALEPVSAPAHKGRLTNQQILLGQKHDPLEIIKIYPEDEWEQFVREWLEGIRGKYTDVRRAGGSRDKGRDVIGYVQAMNACGPWDNYQCKHYAHALHPGDLWKELAKLCFYTFDNKYTVPRAYYFVAPWGVGPEAILLFENPANLKAGLIARWEKGDLLRIGKQEIVLEGELRKHVEQFDFSVVKDLPPSQIIEGHRETRYFASRFGGGLVRLPPDKADVPELLRNFTRDNIPEDGCFERLQEAIYDGVIDTAEADHQDGFERVKKTIEVARAIQIDSHPLRECLEGYHRSGVCHQLANDDRLTWVP